MAALSSIQAHVSGLPDSSTSEGVLSALRAATSARAEGLDVLDFVCVFDKKSGACRGNGFATLASIEDRDAFISALDGADVFGDGAVSVAVPKVKVASTGKRTDAEKKANQEGASERNLKMPSFRRHRTKSKATDRGASKSAPGGFQ
ncbi:hypothetical protein M885DRAFT_510697 [Pelagophyceae sp. CCMP2097]|nr:hypothetical protein M885DRAFT_510697 [Pelagophyceae sp. CCMP2097]|mmetsp:Transcript_29747/g.100199  ORF Transcript_29747/g.100199 Transcript_29747/m.100199 type:complete len:147 (-) Transcript_29747:24-464(-)